MQRVRRFVGAGGYADTSGTSFGFIKYHNFADGSNCIRGFYHWGYEAKWARVGCAFGIDRTQLMSSINRSLTMRSSRILETGTIPTFTCPGFRQMSTSMSTSVSTRGRLCHILADLG